MLIYLIQGFALTESKGGPYVEYILYMKFIHYKLLTLFQEEVLFLHVSKENNEDLFFATT